MVSCTVTVTAPDGSNLSATPMQPVTAMVPAWTCTGMGGTMQVNTTSPDGNGSDYWLWAGPLPGTSGSGNGGMIWHASVTSPAPALFGNGSLAIAQIITPNNSFVAFDSARYRRTYYGSNYDLTGLDAFPYRWSPGYSPPQYAAGDAPGFALTDSMTSAHSADQFTDYLMYQPPGNNVQWVPRGTFSWSTDGSAIKPQSGWSAFGSGLAGPVTPSGSDVPFSKSNTFPMWTRSDAGEHF